MTKAQAQTTIPAASDGKTLPLNGRQPGSQPYSKIEEKRRQAMKKAEEAQEEMIRLEEEEAEEQYAVLRQLESQRNAHLADAKGFREMAKNETDEDEKRKLLQLALADDRKAQEIGLQLGIMPADETAQPQPKRPLLKRPVAALLQVAGILALVGYCYSMFNNFHDWILKMNEGKPIEQHLQPYDATSIQKFFYEKMVVFADLPVALLITFLVVPFVGFYVLPFLKSKKDFYTEFNEELTPWQRSVISTAFILGFLLFLALSHSVKP